MLLQGVKFQDNIISWIVLMWPSKARGTSLSVSNIVANPELKRFCVCMYVSFVFLHCCLKDFYRWEQYQAWSVVLWAKNANNARVLPLKYCQLARLNPILSLGLSTNGALQQIFNSNCLWVAQERISGSGKKRISTLLT